MIQNSDKLPPFPYQAGLLCITLLALSALGLSTARLIHGASFPVNWMTRNWAIGSVAGSGAVVLLLAILFARMRQSSTLMPTDSKKTTTSEKAALQKPVVLDKTVLASIEAYTEKNDERPSTILGLSPSKEQRIDALQLEDALRVAAQKGHHKTVLELLKKCWTDDETVHLTTIVIVEAAKHGHAEIIKKYRIPEKATSCLDLAVQEAAKAGYVDVLNALFDKLTYKQSLHRSMESESWNMLNSAIINAASCGQMPALNALLAKLQYDNPNRAGYYFVPVYKLAFNAGIKNGHATVVDALLSEIEVHIDHVKMAVEANPPNFDIVSSLLSRLKIDPDRDSAYWGKLVNKAVQKGATQIGIFLFLTSPIPKTALEMAIKCSARSGYKDVLLVLLTRSIELEKSCPYFIRIDYTAIAAEIAAKEGHLDTVLSLLQFALNQQRISQLALKAGAKMAIEKDHIEMAMLLSSMDKGKEALAEMIADALFNDEYVPIIEQLLIEKRISFSDNSLRIIAYSAASHSRIKIFEHITSLRVIFSTNDLQSTMIFAARGGRLEVVQCLLRGWDFDPRQLDRAIERAAVSGHLPIVQLLLPAGRMLQSSRLREIICEILNSQMMDMNILIHLLRGRALDAPSRGACALAAAGQNNPLALEAILRNGDGVIYEGVARSCRTVAAGSRAVLDLLDSANVIPDPTPQLVAARQMDLPEDVLICSLEEVNNSPSHFLDWIKNHGMPRRVKLKDSPAVDLGGVTKQLITTLISACGLHCVDAEGLLYKEDFAQKLGVFFSHLETRNKHRSEKFLVGSLCVPAFYALVKAVGEHPPGEEENLLKAAAAIIKPIKRHLSHAVNFILNPHDPNAVKMCNEAKEDNETTEEHAADCLAPFLNAAKAFYSGLNPDVKKIFKSQTADAICEYFQGKDCTAEAILGNIAWNNCYDDPHFDDKRNLLTQMIQESSPEWRQKFVFAISGNRTLSAAKITVQSGFRGPNTTEIHTCFNSLDLPTGPINSQEEQTFFNGQIDTAIEDNGYNVA